jgi:S1-C subfamily serine protease
MNKTDNTNRALLSVVVLAALCLFVVAAQSFATQSRGQSSRNPISQGSRDLARQAVTAVGLITVRNATDATLPRPRGSAVFISRDGLVATNYHVISFESPQNKIERIYDELFITLSNENTASLNSSKRFRLKTVLVNKPQDLALLRVVPEGEGQTLTSLSNFPAVEIGDSRAVKLLEDIIIIGFPEKGGSTITVNTGVIEGKDNLNNWIKTDARLIHGNSGGAAVNSKGQLVGIPTKVIYDTRKIDKDGDGFPDQEEPIGAVGFLRPAHLLVEMMKQLGVSPNPTIGKIPPQKSLPPRKSDPNAAPELSVPTKPQVMVRGVVKAAPGLKPVAGARIGLVLLGSAKVTEENLLAWGGTNAEGKFALNHAVPVGRYTLKVKAIGYDDYSLDVNVAQNSSQISIELRLSR